MIHIDRGRVPRPDVLDLSLASSPARRELEEARHFFSEPRGQRRFAFKVFTRPQVRAALKDLFFGKCAYCEVNVAALDAGDIELFRPKASVLERPEHPGYWWLAAVWENMLFSCANCNRVRDHDGIRTGKANRFPLFDESNRAFKPGDEKIEQPLLLDPCADWPEEHLVFLEDGTVVSETQRGQATISVIGLNRLHLVNARAEIAKAIRASIQVTQRLLVTRKFSEAEERVAYLQKLCEPREEFAGLKRQLIKPFLAEAGAVSTEAATPIITAARKEFAASAFAAFEVDQSSYSLKDEEGQRKYRGQRRLIESISIRDIRAIRELDLDLTPTTERTPWLMLLGENSTGKSTVLQTTALALLGAESFLRLAKECGLHPSQFIRYECKSGSISVKLSGFPKPHKLVFRQNRVEFTSPTGEKTPIVWSGDEPRIKGPGWEPQTLLLGYGATRLLPREPYPRAAVEGEFSRVDNLFDPFVPLIDAEAWLLALDRERFDNIAPILRDLLPLPEDAELVAEDKRIVVAAHGARVPLRQLSDGYQSVVAMTVDILEVALRIWPNLQEAEGTVLLDEVGAHLHPTWKMGAVSSLRKAFPAMQFLATTHDPLCLRGLGKGEVAVMRRREDSQVFALSGLPSPGDFRVDQLLTSDFFGLNSTVDPDTEAIFDEYYALLALDDRSDEQNARLGILRQDLKNRRHFGATLRDNLMYHVIDRLVAQHRAHPRLPIEELKEEAVAEVSRIWNEEPA